MAYLLRYLLIFWLLWIALATLLAWAGFFHGRVFWIFLAVCAVWFAWRWSSGKKGVIFRTPSIPSALFWGSVLVFIFLTTFTFFQAQTLFEGRDQGAISHAAYLLAHHHSLHIPLEEAQSFFAAYGEGKALNFPGFYYDEVGALTPQFPHPVIAWYASFLSIGIPSPIHIMTANAIALFVFAATFFSLLRHFTDRNTAGLFTLLALLAFPVWWFARFSLTEILFLALLWTSILFLLRVVRKSSAANLATLTLSLSILAITRIEGPVFTGLTLLAFLSLPLLHTKSKMARAEKFGKNAFCELPAASIRLRRSEGKASKKRFSRISEEALPTSTKDEMSPDKPRGSVCSKRVLAPLSKPSAGNRERFSRISEKSIFASLSWQLLISAFVIFATLSLAILLNPPFYTAVAKALLQTLGFLDPSANTTSEPSLSFFSLWNILFLYGIGLLAILALLSLPLLHTKSKMARAEKFGKNAFCELPAASIRLRRSEGKASKKRFSRISEEALPTSTKDEMSPDKPRGSVCSKRVLAPLSKPSAGNRERFARISEKLLAIVIILSPSLLYFFHPFISADHPWMLRRFTIAATLCIFLIGIAFFAARERNLFKKPWLPNALLGLLFASQLIPIFHFFTVRQDTDLYAQTLAFSRNFHENDLVLVGPDVSGSGFTMLPSVLREAGIASAYFFNSEDLERGDFSNFDSVFLLMNKESSITNNEEWGTEHGMGVPFSGTRISPSFTPAFPKPEFYQTENTLFRIR